MTSTTTAQAKSHLLTPLQIDYIFCDIATAAKQIDTLATLLIAGCDTVHDDEVFKLSIAMIAQRIGWAADMAMAHSDHSMGPSFGGAEQWMMPPAFHTSPASLP